MNHYHLQHIATIREAHQMMTQLQPDQVHADGFYDRQIGSSDIMGWYARTRPEMKDRDLSRVAFTEFMVKAAPLAAAINHLLEYCLPPEINHMDAYSVCKGWHPAFTQATPHERCMACLDMILKRVDVDIPPLDKVQRADALTRTHPASTPSSADYYHKA